VGVFAVRYQKTAATCIANNNADPHKNLFKLLSYASIGSF
jgi:hypothetical protein